MQFSGWSILMMYDVREVHSCKSSKLGHLNTNQQYKYFIIITYYYYYLVGCIYAKFIFQPSGLPAAHQPSLQWEGALRACAPPGPGMQLAPINVNLRVTFGQHGHAKMTIFSFVKASPPPPPPTSTAVSGGVLTQATKDQVNG